MSTEKKYTPHPHAEVIKAWADGRSIQIKYPRDDKWHDFPEGWTPRWHPEYSYRVEPEEVVDYTIVFDNGSPGSFYLPSLEAVLRRYSDRDSMQGFLKRTALDGKVVKMEFIPK